MNILVQELPETVEVAGEAVPIRTDFRAALRVMLAYEDPELTPQEKQLVMLANLYPELPDDVGAAIEAGIRFLNGGEVGPDEDGPRLCSFSNDANFIFSAFRQTHQIDLQAAELHWFEFLALFMDLGAETTFCSLVSLRKRVKSGKASKHELEAARELGDVFRVPEIDNRSPEERRQEDEFMKAVAEAKRKRAEAK